VLNITPPAVSQFKKGRACFNPHQLERIVKFLDFAGDELDGFYSDLFNARLMWSDGGAARSGRVAVAGENPSPSIPVCEFVNLHSYEPALESIEHFAARHESGRLLFDGSSSVCAFCNDSDPLHPMVVVDGAAYAVKAGVVLLALRDGEIAILRAEPRKDGWRFFDCDHDRYRFDWHPELAPGLVRWMHPALAVR